MKHPMVSPDVPLPAKKPVPKKRFVPVGDQVAIHVYLMTETQGGVLLPDRAAEGGDWRSPMGLVVAVGPDVKQIKEGDKVVLHPSTVAMKVRFQGDEYIVLSESKVCGVVLPEE